MKQFEFCSSALSLPLQREVKAGDSLIVGREVCGGVNILYSLISLPVAEVQ